jgi:hypothetical protein
MLQLYDEEIAEERIHAFDSNFHPRLTRAVEIFSISNIRVQKLMATQQSKNDPAD